MQLQEDLYNLISWKSDIKPQIYDGSFSLPILGTGFWLNIPNFPNLLLAINVFQQQSLHFFETYKCATACLVNKGQQICSSTLFFLTRLLKIDLSIDFIIFGVEE